MKSKTICIMFAACLFPSLTYAACDANACTSKIANLYVTGGGDVYIQPSDSPVGKVDCTLAESSYLVLTRSHVSFSELYSMALAAKISDKAIRMRIINGSNPCRINYFMMSD
jgi:hypothetical protein